MKLQPNRPVRVGTERMFTGASGKLPKGVIPTVEEVLSAEVVDDLPALSGMKKADLEKQAKKEGVDLSGASNNDERRAAIEKARKG